MRPNLLLLGLLACLLASPLASSTGAIVHGELRLKGELDAAAPSTWILWSNEEQPRTADLHGTGTVVTILQMVVYGKVGPASLGPWDLESIEVREIDRTTTPVQGDARVTLEPHATGWARIEGPLGLSGTGRASVTPHPGLSDEQATHYPSYLGSPVLTTLPGLWIERQTDLSLHVGPGPTHLVFARGNLTIGDQRFEAGRQPVHEAADGTMLWLETLHVLQGTWSLDTTDAPKHVIVPGLTGGLAGTLDATSARVQGDLGPASRRGDATPTYLEGQYAFQARYQDQGGRWNVTDTSRPEPPTGSILLGAMADLDLATTTAAAVGVGILAKLVAALVSRQLLADPLGNDTRRLVHEAIQAGHGPTAAELRRDTHLGNGTLRYHLYVLQKAGLVKTHTHHGRIHFHPAGDKVDATLQARAREDEANATIIAYVQDHPGTPQTAILAHLKDRMPRTTVQRRLKDLQELGLLAATKHGRTRCYQAAG